MISFMLHQKTFSNNEGFSLTPGRLKYDTLINRLVDCLIYLKALRNNPMNTNFVSAIKCAIFMNTAAGYIPTKRA